MSTIRIRARTRSTLSLIMRRAVIGASEKAPGMWHPFGFSGHGFQLGTTVGHLLAELIVDGKSPLPIEAFRSGRFNEGTPPDEMAA